MKNAFDVGRVSKSGKGFEWSIPDFLWYATDHEFGQLHSPLFSMSGMEWMLSLGDPRLSERHGCFYFVLSPINSHREAAVTLVTFALGIKTSNGEIVDPSTCTRTLFDIKLNGLCMRIEKACGDLRIRQSTYLPSGTLTLAFHLQIGDGSVPSDGEEERTNRAPVASSSHFDSGTREESERQTRSAEECPRGKNRIDKTAEKDATERPQGLTKLLDDFKDLLLNETDTDVVLKVGGKEFKAHRVIIRARSPVLFAMFAHDTEERRTGVVNIEDCDPNTFPDFLRYVYTGRVEALTEQKALHLYRTADKYQMLELKEQCLELLKRGVSVDNFCDVLALSLQHSERELREIATQFFVDNSFEIAQTPRWQTFMIENPTTANELCLKSFQKGR